jgi:hypothetical protein
MVHPIASAGFSTDSTGRKVQQDSMSFHRLPMGLFDLNLGLNYRSALVLGAQNAESLHRAAGVSGRMQTSILWSLRGSERTHRFTWGDIIGAELFAGTLSTTFSHQTGKLWVAYKFEFGVGGTLRLSDQSEAGLNLIILKFSRDNVSGNISGSGITGRYRYKAIMIEAGAEARHERVAGIFTSLHKNIPLQLNLTGRILMKGGKNAGLTCESLQGVYHQDDFQYSRIWSLKIFYGIYF